MVQHQNINKPNETPILFVNFTDKDFTFQWDSIPYTLSAKETRWFPFWLALHAKNVLVDQVMNDLKIPTDHHSREIYAAKCLGNKPGEVKKEDPLGLDILNRNMKEKEKEQPLEHPVKKSGRSKKEVKGSDESSFEGK